MTMNSRWRALFFNFTNAPVTGLPAASCTTPSMVEEFSAADANWQAKKIEIAASNIANQDRVLLDFIPVSLEFLPYSWRRSGVQKTDGREYTPIRVIREP